MWDIVVVIGGVRTDGRGEVSLSLVAIVVVGVITCCYIFSKIEEKKKPPTKQ